MNSTPRIGEGEWEVMEVLWNHHPQTAIQIVQAIMPHHPWKDPTIRTMVGRLVQKRALGVTIEKNIYYYHPLITREQCVEKMSDTFLDRVFSGAPGPLVLHFLKSKPLTDQDLQEFESILKAKKKERKR